MRYCDFALRHSLLFSSPTMGAPGDSALQYHHKLKVGDRRRQPCAEIISSTPLRPSL